MRVDFPIEWDEQDDFEIPVKGCLSNVIVHTTDGIKHTLSFYDPVRLSQEIESEINNGKAGFIERGLIVVPEVTKTNIEQAIKLAESEGYFQSV